MTDPAGPQTSYYSPEPHYRPAWAQHLDETGEPAGPRGPSGTWPGGARAGGPPPAPVPIGALLAVSLLSAIIGSGGTYLLLASGGRLEPAATSTPSGAAAGVTPTARVSGGSDPIVSAAATVSPAVVTITSVTNYDPRTGTVPQVGVGSGVIFDTAGWILTNCHVVKGGSSLEVALQDGRTFGGQVYGIDTLTDLAIVKIEATGLSAAPIGDSGSLQPGQQVIAVGSPLGTYTNTVTSGIVSALGRSIAVGSPVEGCNDDLHNLIQTDAAINQGNSGGALADAAARIVGINTAVATQAEGIGFAIPINIAKPIMAQAIAGQALARPYMGVRYVALDAQEAAARSLSIDFGALLTASPDGAQPAVTPGGPAAQAGLLEGDVITAIDGVRIDSHAPLEDLLSQHRPGDDVTLEVVRAGRTISLTLTLGTRPAGL
jgi:S1-C subfamily serine protease